MIFFSQRFLFYNIDASLFYTSGEEALKPNCIVLALLDISFSGFNSNYLKK